MSEIFVRIELMIDYINNADIKYPNGPLAYDNNSNSVYHSFLYAMSGFGAADAAHRLRVDDQGNLMPYGQGGETFEKYADAHILLSDEPFLGGNTNFLPTSFGFAYDDQGMSPVSAYGAKISS